MAKKKFMIAAACLAAAMAIGGLAACGGEEDSNNENSGGTNTDTPAATTSISYQFTGNYTDSTLTGLGYDYYILLNLYSDGTAKGSGYNKLSMDSSAYASNSGFSENWWTGSWEATQNEENVDCILLNVSYGSDAKNLMSGTILEGSFEYELYESSTGAITFTIDCPIFSGRTQEISGSSTVQYADLDAFIQGNLYTWTVPDNILEFETTSDSADARLYLQEDGTALFYKGITDPATSEVKYLLSETWSWGYADGGLTLVTSGSTSIAAEVSGTAASFTYTASVYGYETVYSFACSDISVLSQYENVSGGGDDETAAVVTFTESGGGTLILYSDNSAVLSAYSGALTVNYTWSYNGGSLVLTDAEDSTNTLSAEINGTAATIAYSATLGGYEISFTFTCDDISAVTSASETTSAVVVTFTESGGGTVILYSDNTAVLSAYSGMLTVNYTWSYNGGSLVLTGAEDSTNTLTAEINGTAATIAYSATLGGYEISFTFTCDDISAVIS